MVKLEPRALVPPLPMSASTEASTEIAAEAGHAMVSAAISQRAW